MKKEKKNEMRVKPVPTKGASGPSKDRKLSNQINAGGPTFGTSSTIIVSSRQQLYQHLLEQQQKIFSQTNDMSLTNAVTISSKQNNPQPFLKNLKEMKKSGLDVKLNNALKLEISAKKNVLKSQNDQNPGNCVVIKDEMDEKINDSLIKALAKSDVVVRPVVNRTASKNMGESNQGRPMTKSDAPIPKALSKNKQPESISKLVSNTGAGIKITPPKNFPKSVPTICLSSENNKKASPKLPLNQSKTSSKIPPEKLALKKEVKEKSPKTKGKNAGPEKGKTKQTNGNKTLAGDGNKVKVVNVKKEKKTSNEPKHQLSANYNKKRRVHRMASLNALAKVHILYENESRGSPSDCSETDNSPADSLTDASMDVTIPSCESIKRSNSEASSSTSKSICLKTEHKGVEFCPKAKKSKKEDSASSCCSDDSVKPKVKKILQNDSKVSCTRSSSQQRTKNASTPKKEPLPKKIRKRKATSDVEIIDTKTCKRLACLNAQAILAASYSPERSRKVPKSLASCKVDEITTINKKEIMTYNHEIVTDQSITTQVTNHQTCTTFIRQKQQQKPAATSTTLAKQSTTSLHSVIKKSATGNTVGNRGNDETRINAVKSDPGLPSTTVADTKAAQQNLCKVRKHCATSQESRNNAQTTSDTVRKVPVGVTAEYTEVTKVHINTTKEMQLKKELCKTKRRRTIERITEKDDVAITRMYRYQAKGTTSQSYCVKMQTTYKPGNGNKGLVSEPTAPIAHQKSGPILDGVVHNDAHSTPYYNYNPHHAVVPGGQSFPVNHHHSHSGSVARVNGVPVVSVSPMVRHYGGSAFSVPHYGTNPPAPTHSQHSPMPYNQMDYGYYPPPPAAAPAHDPQCMIHKPVPYHPQQSPTHQSQMHSPSNNANQLRPLHPPHAHQISSSPSVIPPGLPPHPPPAHSSYASPVSQDPFLMNPHGSPCTGLDRISPSTAYQSQSTMSPHHQHHTCQPLAEGGHSPSQRAPSAHQYHYHHQRSPVHINPPVSYSPSLNAHNSASVSPSPVYHCPTRNVQPQKCIYSPPLSHSSNFGNGNAQTSSQQEYPTYTVLSPVPMGASQTPQQRLISQHVKNLVGGSRNAQAITKSEPITPPEVITLDSPDAFSSVINDSYYNQSHYPTDMSLIKSKSSESPIIVHEVERSSSISIVSAVAKNAPTSSRERLSSRQNQSRDQVKPAIKDGPAWNLRSPSQGLILDQPTVVTIDIETKNPSLITCRASNSVSDKSIGRENNQKVRVSETSPHCGRLGSPLAQRRKAANESEVLPSTSVAPIVPAKKNLKIDKKPGGKNVLSKDKTHLEEDSSSDISILSSQIRSTKKVKRTGSSERKSGPSEIQEVKCEESDDKSKSKSSELSVSPFNSILIKKKLGPKKFSNGWSWEGEPFDKLVFLSNDDPPCLRRCYPAMRHMEGDIVKIRDCVLLKSGPRKIDLPFVAKVAALWETPEDGEMMISLLWYYRPEHTDQGRRPADLEDEIFASKHRDVNSVACIEDKCYVLTFSEYCRYRSRLRMFEQNFHPVTSVVPQPDDGYGRRIRLPPGRVSPEMVFVCRKVYDFRQKRLLKNPI